MPHYKTPDNALHWLDSEEDENFLPVDCVKITDEEAAIISVRNNTLSPRDTLLLGIVTLEAEITPRRRDEAIIGDDKGWLKAQRAKITILRQQLADA